MPRQGQSQFTGVQFSLLSKQKMWGEFSIHPEEIKDLLHILFSYWAEQ